MHKNANNIEPMIPNKIDVALAESTGKLLSAYMKSTKTPALQFVDKKHEKIVLPKMALKLLVSILKEMGQGNAVSLIPIHQELTTQEAATLLNVSRPYLVNLLKEGKIPFRKVGTKRRILANDVIRFKKSINKKRYKALEELTKQAQELHMGY